MKLAQIEQNKQDESKLQIINFRISVFLLFKIQYLARMKSSNSSAYLGTIFKLLICFSLTSQTQSDCPIQYYPSQTIIGFINAEINNDPEKQNSEQTYTYNLRESLKTNTPNVLIGIKAIQYNVGYELQYRALYQRTDSSGTLNFKVMVSDKENRWRRLQFNFIATGHPQVLANSVEFSGLSSDVTKTQFSLVSSIQLKDYMKAKPIIQAYTAGISLRAKISREEMEATLETVKEVQNSQKKYSWKRHINAAANKIIEASSLLNYELTSAALVDQTLTITFTISQSVILESLTVSYIIFNQIDFLLKNNLIYQSFALGESNNAYSFIPLQNTDLTFIGLRGAQFKLNNNLQIQLSATKSIGSFNVYPTQTLPGKYFLYVSFFQTQTKLQSQCQNCPKSIYRFQTFCLDTCPRGYVNVKNKVISTCLLCDISQFLIPNDDNTQCVCAAQYFYSAGTQKCEPCHYSCFSCRNSSACDLCDSLDLTTKRVFANDGKFCVCVDGFFDNQNLICQKCHESCQTCSGSLINECKTCKEGRSFDVSKHCICPANYLDQAGQCVCKQPNFQVDKVCYSRTLVNLVCQKPNMKQRKVNGRSVCQCDEGFQMYQRECISCPKTFILNKQNGLCQCPKTAFLASDNTCVECQAMKQYDTNHEKCLCKKQYFQREDGTCIDCPEKTNYKNGKCQCVFNYYLKDNTCIRCKKTEDGPNCLRVDIGEL